MDRDNITGIFITTPNLNTYCIRWDLYFGFLSHQPKPNTVSNYMKYHSLRNVTNAFYHADLPVLMLLYSAAVSQTVTKVSKLFMCTPERLRVYTMVAYLYRPISSFVGPTLFGDKEKCPGKVQTADVMFISPTGYHTYSETLRLISGNCVLLFTHICIGH